MNRPTTTALLALLLATGCAHVPAEEPPERRLELAREALHGGAFTTADQLLSSLAAEKPLDVEGHEAQFLLGLLHLDPRNPGWNPTEAEHVLSRYLEFPFGERRPEAVVLYALARRLATPLPTRVVIAGDGESAPADVVGEVERLRRELESRDRELAKLRQELERIRRTLAPSR